VSPRDWNARSYDTVSTPQREWGESVVARLSLRGDETVLDAGCGTGRVTEMVLERVPRGRVIAVDGSESMVELARKRLDPGRGTVICADLCELTLEQPVDAIVSTATFHWILDHDALFARMRAAVREGGAFVVQCGGRGNIANVHAVCRAVGAREPYVEHLAAMGSIWNFAGVEQTRERLAGAGFTVSDCWLAEAPTQPEHPREFLETVVVAPFLAQLPAALRDPYLDAVMAELGERPLLDYVRLNWDAVAA